MIRDLFNHPDELPQVVQDIFEKYPYANLTREEMESLLSEVEAHGYTFDYGLDMIPYYLEKREAEPM